jgi:hypothetical protein
VARRGGRLPPDAAHRRHRRGGRRRRLPPVVRQRERDAHRGRVAHGRHRVVVRRHSRTRASAVVDRTVGPAAPHRGVQPRSHRPRLRCRNVRGRGDRARLAGAACRRPRGAAGTVRPLRADCGVQRRRQPTPVPSARAAVADGVPLPGRDLPVGPDVRHGRSRGRAAPRAGRDRRSHVDVAPRRPRPLLRRLLHLGLPQRRQSAEGAALSRGMGHRAAADGGAVTGSHAPRPRRPGRGRGPRAASAHRYRRAARVTARPNGGDDERGRPAGRDRAHRASAGPLDRAPLSAAGVRRARVRRPQRVASLRRLVRREPGPT